MTQALPKHIAIVMDGNGRWAKQRHLPRTAGHKAGVDSVRRIVRCCAERHIEALTLWAFGSENWRRPEQEVSFLLELIVTTLKFEAKKLHKQGIQIRFIGDRNQFSEKLRREIGKAEELTANNTGLKLIIAANYGGKWDVTNAVRQVALDVQNGTLLASEITPESIAAKLQSSDLPDPELFIRTSGEQRLSNFMIWQCAYSELYFSPVFWPDFTVEEFDKALDFYLHRERRFGYISEQLSAVQNA